jgi:hypothetical protein
LTRLIVLFTLISTHAAAESPIPRALAGPYANMDAACAALVQEDLNALEDEERATYPQKPVVHCPATVQRTLRTGGFAHETFYFTAQLADVPDPRVSPGFLYTDYGATVFARFAHIAVHLDDGFYVTPQLGYFVSHNLDSGNLDVDELRPLSNQAIFARIKNQGEHKWTSESADSVLLLSLDQTLNPRLHGPFPIEKQWTLEFRDDPVERTVEKTQWSIAKTVLVLGPTVTTKSKGKHSQRTVDNTIRRVPIPPSFP